MIAARMAFKDAYTRLANGATLHNKLICWTICLGENKSLGEAPIQVAIRARKGNFAVLETT